MPRFGFGTLRGFGIISGLALGCDTAGHEGALDGGGFTCAVLAHGPDTITPAANNELADRILENGGALVSEHAPGIPPSGPKYASRNQIISRLSTHVIVVETAEKGGTMHTARFAYMQNRELGVLELPSPEGGSDYRSGFEAVCRDLGGVALSGIPEVLAFVGVDESSG